MVVRECVIEDYQRIHDINSTAFGYLYDLDKTKERLAYILKRKTDKIFIADIDGDYSDLSRQGIRSDQDTPIRFK